MHVCEMCDRASAAELDRIVGNQGAVLAVLLIAVTALTWALFRKGVLTPADLAA